MPDKSARRVERPEGDTQGEHCESYRKINKLDPGLRRGDTLSRISLIYRSLATRYCPCSSIGWMPSRKSEVKIPFML